MKLGVVDVGGGMRGVFASGVLDYCLEAGIKFDCCVGVSAGSANLIRSRQGGLLYPWRVNRLVGNIVGKIGYRSIPVGIVPGAVSIENA